MDDTSLPKSFQLDEEAQSTNSELPAFLARPEGAPVYHGFRIIEETCTNGWCFGAITNFLKPDNPDGCTWGDGFIVAPDGSRAGIVWSTDVAGMYEILPPDEERWGVYEVQFLRPVRTVEDLVWNFRQVLPDLQRRYAQVRGE